MLAEAVESALAQVPEALRRPELDREARAFVAGVGGLVGQSATGQAHGFALAEAADLGRRLWRTAGYEVPALAVLGALAALCDRSLPSPLAALISGGAAPSADSEPLAAQEGQENGAGLLAPGQGAEAGSGG